MKYSDYYYSNYFGVVGLNAVNLNAISILIKKDENPLNIFIILYNKNGGVKYIWYYNVDFSNSFEAIDFTINKNGFGECSFKLLEKNNIDIKAEDIIEIYNNNQILYKGFASNDIDITNKEIKFYPFLKRLQEWHFNGSFITQTLIDVVKEIITQTADKTKIKYLEQYIDFGNNEPFNFDFKNENIFDILEKLVKLDEDRYWWVDKNEYLHISKIKKNKIDKYLMLHTDKKNYGGITVQFDYSGVEATQYKVFKNNQQGEAIFVGEVGNEGNIEYPPLSVISKIRKIEGIYIASEVVEGETALKIAYADLKQKAKTKQNISIKLINLKEYIPQIDDFLYCEYYEKYDVDYWVIKEIIDNVTQIKYKITATGVNCDLQCGDLINEEGEELFKLKKKVRILETINRM